MIDVLAALEAARGRHDDGQARVAAAREVTVTLFAQLLDAMRKTIPDAGLLPPGPSRDALEDAFDRSVAEAMSRGDPLGLEARLAPAGRPAAGGPAQSETAGLKVPGPSADTQRRQALPHGGTRQEGQDDEGR